MCRQYAANVARFGPGEVIGITRLLRVALVCSALAFGGDAAVASAPELGPNVIVFDPSMPTSQIQATVDDIASKQVGNQFGTERYALLFEPGTYGTSDHPLNFQ